MTATWVVKRGERACTVAIDSDIQTAAGSEIVASVDGRPVRLRLQSLPDGRIAIDDGHGRRLVRTFYQGSDVVVLSVPDQRKYSVEDARAGWLAGSSGAKAGGGKIKASMPGRVVAVTVQVGQVVADGAVVVVLEAMKMENDVRAHGGGVVKTIAVQPGANVEAGALLVELEPAK